MIDPKTKSAVLMAKVPDGSGFNPGQLTQVDIFQTARSNEYVRVPVSATIRLNGKICVFKQVSDGFRPVEVVVHGRTREYATVSGELSAGDNVAISGLTELKAISLEGDQ